MPPMVRAPSIYVPDLTIDSFDASVNDDWMEALDVGSGRLYFVQLEKNASGDSVKPSGETSWEPPKGFLVRQQLVHALARALAAGDDASFLSRVRERFPPPSTPPPGNAPVAATAATSDGSGRRGVGGSARRSRSSRARRRRSSRVLRPPRRPSRSCRRARRCSARCPSPAHGSGAHRSALARSQSSRRSPPLGRWRRRRAASGPTLKGRRWTTFSARSRRNPHSTGGSPAASDRRHTNGGDQIEAADSAEVEMLSQIDERAEAEVVEGLAPTQRCERERALAVCELERVPLMSAVMGQLLISYSACLIQWSPPRDGGRPARPPASSLWSECGDTRPPTQCIWPGVTHIIAHKM